ncbi:MAG: hypothetical protein ABSD88_14710 [Candidatus Korobacteraceae bacterium]
MKMTVEFGVLMTVFCAAGLSSGRQDLEGKAMSGENQQEKPGGSAPTPVVSVSEWVSIVS